MFKLNFKIQNSKWHPQNSYLEFLYMCIPHHKTPKLFLKVNVFTIVELESLNRLKKSCASYISQKLQTGGKCYCYAPSFSQLVLRAGIQ